MPWKPKFSMSNISTQVPGPERFSFEPEYNPDLGPIQHIPAAIGRPVETTDEERREGLAFMESIDYMCPVSEPNGIQTFEHEVGGNLWRMTIVGDLTNLQPPTALPPVHDGQEPDVELSPGWVEDQSGHVVDMRICPGLTVAVICRSMDLEDGKPLFFHYNKSEWDHLSQSVGLVDLLWGEFQIGSFLVGDWHIDDIGADDITVMDGIRVTLKGNGLITVLNETTGASSHTSIYDIGWADCEPIFGTRQAPCANAYGYISKMAYIDMLDMDQMGATVFDSFKKSCASNHTPLPTASSTEADEFSSAVI